MGICVSSEYAAAAASTARVVLPSGELREYPPPVTAARALEDAAAGQGWFLCDADAMGFEGSVAAVGGGEELRPGQIYFVLPAEMRRRRLRPEEVAALAVKASDALVKAAASSGGRRRRRGSVAPLVFAPPEEVTKAEVVAVAVAKRQVRRRGGKKRHDKFAPDLTAIPECDMSE